MSGSKHTLRGGGFVVGDTDPNETRTPEDFDADQVAMRASATAFVKRSVLPHLERLDGHDSDLLKRLMREFGEQGYLAVEVSEAHGGLGLDLTTSVMVFEGICHGGYASFGATVGAHCGIGTWPILFFGNDAQREKFLPGILSGERIAAYALTESGSGSDALSARMTAVVSDDGSEWVLNGEKVFITNAGIADVFTVFAKVAGQNACFVVERGTPGFSVEKEERKLGLFGSSTCRIVFDDVRVPIDHLLGEIGKGHKVVMNTLNLGRLKLGAAGLGGMKCAIDLAVRYADGRMQFGRPLHGFDAIRRKIADMEIDVWVGEAMVYRTAGMLSERLHGASGDDALQAIEEHELECAIVKTMLTEMLWSAADETLQIFGGYGYIEEFPAARLLRDARVNRIFEGTNEICRLHVIGTLLKRGLMGRLDLGLIMPAKDEGDWGGDGLSGDRDAVRKAVRLLLPTVFRNVVRKYVSLRDLQKAVEKAMSEDQQALMDLADLVMILYAMDSALIRLEKLRASETEIPQAIVQAFFEDSLGKAALLTRRILAEVSGDAALGSRAVDQLLSRHPAPNVNALRRAIAQAAIERIAP